MSHIIHTVFAGQIDSPWAGKDPSAIGKIPISGPHAVTHTGLARDDQADKIAHGGIDKALHHYPADHYNAWRQELGDNPRFGPGGFGENLSTEGLTETDVCIGDIFALGSIRLEISQGRQPCWKLAAHTGIESMAYHVRKTLRTGWYYRVLDEGQFDTGDTLVLLDRPNPDWSVHRATQAFFDPNTPAKVASELSELPALFADWRSTFRERAQNT